MAMGGGTLVVLGTTVVAVLAVGAAVGAHTLVGDSTVEAAPSASSSPTESPTPSPTSDEFCVLMADMVTYGVDGGPPFGEGDELVVTYEDEAADLEAIHAWGQNLIEVAGPLAAIERDAAEIVDDSSIASAFEDSAAGYDLFGETLGVWARDAESTNAFYEQVMAAAEDPEFDAVGTAADEATKEIDAYVADRCEIFLTGTDSAALAAKADVSTLGMEVATFFVDWNEGDPLPEVTISRGSYYLQGVRIADVSKGVELVDQDVNGMFDWCVSVSYEGRADATYRYSAVEGLGDGSCAALGGAESQWPPSR